MAALTYTYATLTADIQSFVEDDSAEFVAAIPNIIGLGELRIYKDVELEVTKKEASVSLSSGVRTATKPSDYLFSRYAFITDGGALQRLRLKDPSWIYDYWPSTTATDTPLFYASANSTQFLVAPTPDTSYTMTLGYVFRPDRLDGTTTTTWLSLNAPELLLYACLCESVAFLQELGQGPEPGMIQVWEQKYGDARTRVRDEEMRRQRMEDARFGENRGFV